MEGETMANEDKRTWAEIDLGRLYHNYREVRRVLPEGCRFAGLCKANAYGHGAMTIAKRLEEIGADYIAVSCYEEAAELRSAGLKMPILLLAPSPAFLAPDIARLDVQQAIGDIDCARGMSRALAGTPDILLLDDATEAFASARTLHFELEDIYVAAMDFRKADRLRDMLINEIF